MPNSTRLGDALNQINEGGIRLQPSEYTPWLDQQSHTIATDPTIPNSPTLTATAADQSIDLKITKPDTNMDGSSYQDHKQFVIYYSSSPGIDVSDPLTYSGRFETTSTQHTHATESRLYFRAVCQDMHGNTSAASAEVDATPTSQETPPAVDDYTNNIANVYVGKGMIGVQFQPPKPTWVRFAAWKLYFDTDTGGGWTGSWTLCYTGAGPGFLHKGLNESYKYKYRLSALAEDGTETTGTVSDNGGTGYQPNQSDNSTLLAVTIFAERIICQSEMVARTFIGGKLQSTNWGTSLGSLFDLDAGTIKLGGSSAPKFQVGADGVLAASGATISGAITASSGTIGGFTIGSSALTAGSGGTAVGMAPGSYPFYAGNSTPSSAPFRVSSSGAVTCTNINITGGDIAGSTISGTLLGCTFQGSSSYPYAKVTGSDLWAFQSASYYGRLTPSQLTITGATDTMILDQSKLQWQYGSPTIQSGDNMTIKAGAGYHLSLGDGSSGSAVICVSQLQWSNMKYTGTRWTGTMGTANHGIYFYSSDGNRYILPAYGPV